MGEGARVIKGGKGKAGTEGRERESKYYKEKCGWNGVKEVRGWNEGEGEEGRKKKGVRGSTV